MATLLMLALIFSELKALAHFQNGLTTISSFVFPEKNYLNTISYVRTNIITSLKMVDIIVKAVGSGIVGARWLMTILRNLMKIIAGLSRTCCLFHRLIVCIPTVMLISTLSLTALAFLGKALRRFLLVLLSHIWVLDGILMQRLSPYLSTKKRNISSVSLNGTNDTLTLSSKFRAYIYGKLLHSCLVIQEGQAYLTSLEAMLSISIGHPFVPCSPSRGAEGDLQWWSRTLQRPSLFRHFQTPKYIIDPCAYSDASSGVGIVIGQRWRAWHLLPGWKTEMRHRLGRGHWLRTPCPHPLQAHT